MSDLAKRILVAAVGVPLLLGAARYGSGYIAVLVVALQLAILPEWLRLWRAYSIRLSILPLLIGLAGADSLVFTAGSPLGIAAAAVALALMFILAPIGSRPILARLGGTALYVLYVVVPLALWTHLNAAGAHVRLQPAGALVVLLITVWICDSAAFFVGRAMGRHRLWQEASPNKTVEGFIGGLIGAALVLPIMTAFHWTVPRVADYVVIPVLVGLSGQAGDLLESLFKRDSGLKDTSQLLPGHGGLLDRFDSLLLSTPFFFAYLTLTTP